MNPEIENTLVHLKLAILNAEGLRTQLTDLHSLAYDKHVGGHEVTSGSRPETYLDEVGSKRAKSVWKQTQKQVFEAMKRLEVALVLVNNLLTDGPGPDDSMRGTTIRKSEFDERLARQKASRRRGEYVPTINPGMEQPAYPTGKGGVCSHCHELPHRAKGLCAPCGAYYRKYKRLPSEQVLKARGMR